MFEGRFVALLNSWTRGVVVDVDVVVVGRLILLLMPSSPNAPVGTLQSTIIIHPTAIIVIIAIEIAQGGIVP